jgi:hypothetical protein
VGNTGAGRGEIEILGIFPFVLQVSGAPFLMSACGIGLIRAEAKPGFSKWGIKVLYASRGVWGFFISDSM